jgi:hypothetical protein
MTKSGFWKSDWVLGPVVLVPMPFARNGDLLRSLERGAYDFGAHATSRVPQLPEIETLGSAERTR